MPISKEKKDKKKMASSLVLKVANVTSTVVFSKADSDVATVLKWFIKGWASPEPTDLTPAALNQWRLDQAAARIALMVRQEARSVRLRELRDAQASLEDAATNDTSI